jgi:hypothetical protein
MTLRTERIKLQNVELFCRHINRTAKIIGEMINYRQRGSLVKQEKVQRCIDENECGIKFQSENCPYKL